MVPSGLKVRRVDNRNTGKQKYSAMDTYLIDQDGEVWRGNSRQLRVAYDTPYSGGEFSTYAMKNLGFIGLQIYGRSCQVLARFEVVTQRAVLGLHRWVQDNAFDRYVVSDIYGGGNLSLFTSSDEVLRVVGAVADEARANSNQSYFLKDLQDSPIPGVRRLQDMLVNRRFDLSNQDDLSALRQHTNEVFDDRYIMARRRADNGSLAFRQIGQELFRGYGSWRAQAIDAPVSELPDATYGTWVQQAYGDALTSGKPLHQQVDAVVKWPLAGKARLRYDRAIIPFVDGDGLPCLISGTAVNNGIDLRLDVV